MPVFEDIVQVDDVGMLPTYDLAVEGPFHNFVADGFVVHNSFAERSARYTPLPDFNYMPTPERLLEGGGHLTKQAASVDGARVLDYESALAWLDQLAGVYEHAERVYQQGLYLGVPKELARLSMTVGRYSTMRASTDLRNWLGFCTLRLPKNAQKEIRVYAEAVHDMLALRFPRTLALFDEGMNR